MHKSISIPGVVAGVILGIGVRYGLTFSEIYHPGWFWWFHHGLHTSPGTAGFAGFVDNDILMSNYEGVGFCMVVSLFPGLIGGVIGAVSGAVGRPLVGAMIGGLVSGIVTLLMRFPELYRPGWFGSLWFDYNVPIVLESVGVGAIVGALAGGIARLSRTLRSPHHRPMNVEQSDQPDPPKTRV